MTDVDLGGVLSEATKYGDARAAAQSADDAVALDAVAKERDAALADLAVVTDSRDELARQLAAAVDEIARLQAIIDGDPEPPDLPMVQPLSAMAVNGTLGICDHPNFTGAYDDRHGVIAAIASTGVRRVRGMFPDNDADAQATVDACREFGIKWTATVYATESKPSDIKVATKIRKIAATAADVVDRIEGPNEWNNSRSGGTPLTAVQTVAAQKNIYTTVRSLPALDVLVLGPSCHDPTVAGHKGKDWVDLKDAGILAYQDAAAVHSYPAGGQVDQGMDARLAYVYAAYGPDYPVEITEGGWTTGGDTGHVKVTELEAARQTERAPFIMATRGHRYDVYEALDESLVKSGDAFGLFEVQTNGARRPKPAVERLKAVQLLTADAGDPYTPTPIGLEVTGDCTWYAVAKRDGTAAVAMWAATPTEVTVRWAVGEQTVDIGPDLVAVQIN
jgi:hypothetical protein